MPHFPFPTYRTGQKEALEAARDAFASGTRFVIIEAPTGSGKSAIAVALAQEAKASFIVTAQKVLQDQYIRDFPYVSLMKGRANYDCLVAPTHAAAAPCVVGKRFPECEACPYFTAKDEAIAADVTTMNYAYLLAELNYGGGFSRRDLLVLDEAHNIENQLMNFVKAEISEAQLQRAGVNLTIPPQLSDDVLFDFADEAVHELSRRVYTLTTEVEAIRDTRNPAAIEKLRMLQGLENTKRNLTVMLDSLAAGESEWVHHVSIDRSGRVLTFKPVDVAAFAEHSLFRFGKQVLMLSGTILDVPSFCQSLGLNPSEVTYIAVPSSFPPENRPIHLRPVAKLNRFHLQKNLPILLEEIVRIARDHPDEKGIIHTHTYKISSYIQQHAPRDVRTRFVTHDNAGERDSAVARHSSSNEPTILLTPSMTEGLDFAGDLARWQILCKVPYPFLGDPQIERRTKRDQGWYEWLTSLAIVQAYGRAVRSEDDYATTYLLDSDFPRFLRRVRNRLPSWFTEALQDEQLRN